jgi:hypothetical protein
MDQIWRNLLCVLGCGGYGAALGAAFGAVTGAVYWGSGRAAGSGLGQRLAAAFEEAGDELSPRARGALVGAADGFLFLGILGTALGLALAFTGTADAALLVTLAVGGVLVAVAAVVFGVLAYAVVRNGVWAVVGLFLGGITGAFTAAALLGADRLLWGVVPGLIAGTAASFLLRKYEPRFRAARVARATHERWRAGGEDVTAEPPGGPDSVQKG